MLSYNDIVCTPDHENTFVGGPRNGKPVPSNLRSRDYIEVAVLVEPSPRITFPAATTAPMRRAIYRRKVFSTGHAVYDAYSVWIHVQ